MILIQDAVAQGDVRICILAERPNEERKIHHDWRHAPVAAIRLNVEGDPHVISMCHCQVCQRRTGSTYSVQRLLLQELREDRRLAQGIQPNRCVGACYRILLLP
jgi:hypothetical protein